MTLSDLKTSQQQTYVGFPLTKWQCLISSSRAFYYGAFHNYAILDRAQAHSFLNPQQALEVLHILF